MLGCGLTTCASAAGPHGRARTNLRFRLGRQQLLMTLRKRRREKSGARRRKGSKPVVSRNSNPKGEAAPGIRDHLCDDAVIGIRLCRIGERVAGTDRRWLLPDRHLYCDPRNPPPFVRRDGSSRAIGKLAVEFLGPLDDASRPSSRFPKSPRSDTPPRRRLPRGQGKHASAAASKGSASLSSSAGVRRTGHTRRNGAISSGRRRAESRR